ncbi:MAG: phosphoglycerate dehydrogenase [Candidatus Sumerlaeia bacterium]|nr:phosphoglycerate dehydrogenase [Candidatus Sumerlaeia bacterium]
MTYKVLVSDKLSDEGLAPFHAAGFEVHHYHEITQEQIKATIHEYDAWVVRSRSRATADIIERATKLRVIGRAGVGIDNVDVAAASKRGIVVMNTPGGNTISTAEHSIAMLMSAARKIPAADASMRQGKWDKKSFMGVELRGKTLGILGFGRIGQEVAARMKGFQMTILAYDPFVTPDSMNHAGVSPATVDEICRNSDFITIHTPLSAETKGLINAERLKTMKKTAILVNCARGGIIDEQALAEALKAKTIAGAALDVFESEPIPENHILRSTDNIVITPHIAASTVEAQENVAIQVAEQIVDVLKNNKITNALNAPSIEPRILETLKPYLLLCEKLGSFISQFSDKRAVKITTSFSGSVRDYPLSALTTAICKGFVEVSTDNPVNYVNAQHILQERGIDIVETSHSSQFRFSNLMSIAVRYEDGTENSVAGTVFDPDHGRIVMVNGKTFVALPEGNLVVLENNDVPGIIGSVGTFMGQRGINISEMTWGRHKDDHKAMTVINVEGALKEEDVAGIKALPNIVEARLIRL